MNNLYRLCFLFLSFITSSAFATANTLVPALGIGYIHFINNPNQTFRISDYISNSLVNSKQQEHPAFTVNIKKKLDLKQGLFKTIMLGPAFYYQHASFSGEVWELNAPEFYNFNYRLDGENYNLLAEGDFYFSSWDQKLLPFVTAGLGVGISQISYHDRAVSGIPHDEDLLLKTQSSEQLIYEGGAGFALRLNTKLMANIRYVYTHNGHSRSAYSDANNLQNPIRVNLNNQAVFLGISINS